MERPSHPPGFPETGNPGSIAPPQNLPNANMVLILGILSVCCSWWHFVSLAGIILGICALVLAIKVTRSYRRNPAVYNLNSLNNVKTGRLCAMLGLAISTIVFVSVVLSATGVLSKLPYWGMIH